MDYNGYGSGDDIDDVIVRYCPWMYFTSSEKYCKITLQNKNKFIKEEKIMKCTCGCEMKVVAESWVDSNGNRYISYCCPHCRRAVKVKA